MCHYKRESFTIDLQIWKIVSHCLNIILVFSKQFPQIMVGSREFIATMSRNCLAKFSYILVLRIDELFVVYISFAWKESYDI